MWEEETKGKWTGDHKVSLQPCTYEPTFCRCGLLDEHLVVGEALERIHIEELGLDRLVFAEVLELKARERQSRNRDGGTVSGRIHRKDESPKRRTAHHILVALLLSSKALVHIW